MNDLMESLLKYPLLQDLLDTYWEACSDEPEFPIGSDEFKRDVIGAFLDNINDMTKEDAVESLAYVVYFILENKS